MIRQNVSYLRDKYVVVTGAGGGFGTLLTERLLAAGSIVVVTDKTTDLINSPRWSGYHHPRLRGVVAADLASPAGCEQVHREVTRLTPHVDILINNAGIALVGMFAAMPADRWQELLATNLTAPLQLTHHFLPAMIARRSGHIVNICSVAGLLGAPGLAVYSATKAGLRGFGDALRHEVRRHRVAVTTVYPFFARTNILRSPYFGPEAERMVVPQRLINDPAHVADAIIHGISQRKVHVYPDRAAQGIALLLRLLPNSLEILQRSLITPPRRSRNPVQRR